MILQEKIKKEAEGYGKLAPAFIEGAKFALAYSETSNNTERRTDHGSDN